ncbi:autophagy associated protein Atg9 [Schizosaccharomyces octosporus yFS286]|uniref:Autophagy-related protein 9 n=1 Tax=Schizosaccharomyces octosporus (strain yFS286) TaxID=483514 RepID=S9PTL3_SCHOY|nr:autophagy associated protein Atg9 [Schizosaccharomyces octosporus yFS286]EPX72476.1 autophagy associated protein Atg9 [Schizosaccharomyces octosporus yFS286]
MYYLPRRNELLFKTTGDIEAQDEVPNHHGTLEAWQESLDSDDENPLLHSTVEEHPTTGPSKSTSKGTINKTSFGTKKSFDFSETNEINPTSFESSAEQTIKPKHDVRSVVKNSNTASFSKFSMNRFPLAASSSMRASSPNERFGKLDRDKVSSAYPNKSVHTQLPRNEFSGARTLWNRLTPHDRVLWRWANVENLDYFLQQVYSFYVGKGFSCMIVQRLFQILTISFVIGFTTFITSCIDWSAVIPHGSLVNATKSHCIAQMSPLDTLFLWLFMSFLCALWIYYLTDIPRLWHIREFFIHALKISSTDMATVSWQRILYRLYKLKNVNALTAEDGRVVSLHNMKRLDAQAITNRIMRKENYFIALINNDVIDLELPLLRKRILTHTTEWNINWCIFNFVFDDQGQILETFRNVNSRKRLAEELRRRFIVAGFLNCLCSPIVAVYLLVHNFFRYFDEFHKNPSLLGIRRYTPLALWTFREYNELPHVFDERISNSYEYASHYVSQFPDFNVIRCVKYVSFILGSFTAVLVIITLFDPEITMTFELTKDRTVIFYLGIFGSLIAAMRSLIPDETLIFDPEKALRKVAYFTHYLPEWWQRNMDSKSIQQEFCTLYTYRIVNVLWEILGILLTPVLLFFTFPACSQEIVDFFREHTVHVEGVGYVCSHAVFQPNPQYDSVAAMVSSRKINTTFQNKPEMSRINFLQNLNPKVPEQTPDDFLD